MKFEIDKQTIADLDIYNNDINAKTVSGLFTETQSFLGKTKVYELLANPLSNYEELKERTDTIRFFAENRLTDLQLNTDALNFAGYYQKQRRHTIEPTFATAFWRFIFDKLNKDAQYFLMREGVLQTVETLRWIDNFSKRILNLHNENKVNVPKTLLEQSQKVQEIFARNGYNTLVKKRIRKFITVGKLDYLFRIKERRDISFFLDLIYQYDAFSTIAKVSVERGFSFANLTKPEEGNKIEFKGLFHPLLDNPIANDVHLNRDSNLIFLSGPNMAGKSTILKSLAIATFLAHVGFPIPGSKMNFSVLSGISTTINIADDLSSGYSHFFAEVMRVKQVAEKLKENKNMLIIFDELFRGTNVKDAYDGTEAVIKAFSKVKDSFFVVSTHIVEVAEELEQLNNIQFNYMNIEHRDGHPTYSYELKEGISNDRLGMYIIQKEGLIDLIESCATASSSKAEVCKG